MPFLKQFSNSCFTRHAASDPGKTRSASSAKRHRFTAVSAVFAALIAIIGSDPVFAADGDPLEISVFTSLQHDSNLFRLADGVSPGGDGSRSATTWTGGAGLRVDKSYSLQRLSLAATVSRYHYDPYSNLDFTGYTLAASYAWSLTPSLTGNLIYNRRKLPSDFADVGYEQRPNPAQGEDRRLDVDWRAFAMVHPRLSVFEIKNTSDRPVFQRENANATSVELSLIYTARSGNKLEAYGRRASGNYTDLDRVDALLIDPQFTEREFGLRGDWKLSDLTRLDGSIGSLDRTHDSFSVRNFNGAVGRLGFVYTPSGKTEVRFSGSRSLRSSQTAINSYFVEEIYSIAPAWRPTEKITITPSYTWSNRDFKGAPSPVTALLHTDTRIGALQLDWAALRSLGLSLAIFDARRSSNAASLQYRDRGASITASFKF